MSRSTRSQRQARANDVVSLAQRLRYLEGFRLCAAILVLAGIVTLHFPATPAERLLSLVTVVYLGVAMAGGLIWRLRHRRGITLFGALIIMDGVYLAFASYASGGTTSPFRYLIVLHVVTVTLLASYRTGLKLALWHSLLLLTTFQLDQARVIPHVGSDATQTGTFMAVFWLAAFSTAMFAAVNERELRRRKVDVEALAAMAAALESKTDLQAVAIVVASAIEEHFPLRRVVVLEGDERRLAPVARVGDPVGPDDPFEPQADSVVTRALLEHATQFVTQLDAENDVGLEQSFPDARNVIVVPMSADGRSIGVVVAEYARKATRIPRREVEMLDRFVSHGALALRGASLHQEVERLASTDSLTRVANRRAFDLILAREVERARRYKSSVSLIIADIDHFKDLNDKHGHQTGDRVLLRVASLLEHHVRSVDVVARYGGEEFAIIMPQCAPEEAAARAEEMRLALDRENTTVPVSVSFGVAAFPEHGADETKLVQAADRAMYRSKLDGRNRVTVFAPRARRIRSGSKRRSTTKQPKRLAGLADTG